MTTPAPDKPRTPDTIGSNAAASATATLPGSSAAVPAVVSETGIAPTIAHRPSPGRRRGRSATVAALDLGTTKICCLVGHVDESGRPVLTGLGQAPSRGLARGMVRDVDLTVQSIRRAVAMAGDMAGKPVREVTVGIAGSHLQCHNHTATIEVANPLRGVTESDRNRLMERARQIVLPEGRDVVYLAPQEYRCDDQRGVQNPIGICCSRLEVRVHVVTAAVASAQNIIRCARLSGVEAKGLLVESLASSESILSEEERDLGVLLIDIGGGTADVALFHEGAVQFSGTVPFGGDALTRDLAQALRIGRLEAEHLKRTVDASLGRVPSAEADAVTVTRLLTGRKVKAPRALVREVIAARLEEIFEEARMLVDRTPWRGRYSAGVVLTGGTSLVAGIDSLAADIFECDVRLGSPGAVGGTIPFPDSPVYATALGLLQHGAEQASDPNANPASRFFGRVYDQFLKMVDWYA